MNMRYAIVENGAVTNFVVWDGETPYTPPDGAQLIQIPEDVWVDFGTPYVDGQFVESPAVEENIAQPSQTGADDL